MGDKADTDTLAIDAERVLEFWLGDAPAATDAAQLKRWVYRWFSRNDGLDEEVTERFAHSLDQARSGALDGWCALPRGRVALLVLLDQFPRNVYRGSAQAFAADAKALALARETVALGLDAALSPVERVFVYLPFEHAEDLEAQAHAVALFDALRAAAPAGVSGSFSSFHDYALKHRDVIARFGRFPHRNAVLGRASTEAELNYLAQPGSGF